MDGRTQAHEGGSSDDALTGLYREMERDRCRAIICDPHAELRERLANHLAFDTDLTAADAIAVLRGAPVDPPADQDEGHPDE